MRKPTKSAWALNRLAREDSAAVRAVIKAGAALRTAQEKAVAGGSAAKLKERGQEERQAVKAALASAAMLAEAQLSEQDSERMRATLHAAAGDDDVRGQLEAGRLTADHQPIGLGPLGDLEGQAPPLAAKKEAARRPTAARKKAEAADRAARRSVDAAERRLERKTRAAGRAQAELESAQAELEEASAAAAKARARLEAAG